MSVTKDNFNATIIRLQSSPGRGMLTVLFISKIADIITNHK